MLVSWNEGDAYIFLFGIVMLTVGFASGCSARGLRMIYFDSALVNRSDKMIGNDDWTVGMLAELF